MNSPVRVTLVDMIGCAIIIAAALSAAPLAIHAWQASGYIRTLERLEEYHRAQHNYFFDGANKRGLLDICSDAAGDVGIRFADECAPHTEDR